MWTPRRIFFGLVGLLCCAAGYFCYARALGELNGLPPLPEKYLRPPPGADQAVPSGGLSSLEKKVAKAFGANCPELRYPIKTEMRKNNVVICTHKFEIIKSGEREGWVEASPLSMASFSDRVGPEALEEINTVYCDVAYLKFDQPIRSMSDFGGAKMVAVELHADPEAQLRDARKGRVRLLNNRKTYDPNDDIEMVTPGPVYYDAEPRPGQPHIYTQTVVHIFDHLNTELPVPDHTAPRDPTVTGIGLRVFLVQKPKDSPTEKTVAKAPKPKAKSERTPLSGVESIGLDNTVEMNIWTDSDSSFIAPGTSAPEPKAKTLEAKKNKDAPGKRLLQIRTNGPFRYDAIREIAHFEKPAVAKPGLVEHVTVTRSGKAGEQELLDCEYMDVQMRRKQPATKENASTGKKIDSTANESSLEIKSIKAWGETVVVAADGENLHATGSELVHDAEARITILKGSPSRQVQVVKDGNLLRGSEMHLFGDGKQISQAHILGAGSIGMGELDPKTKEFHKQAIWTDRLVYTRIEENKQPIDVFTIIGKDGVRAIFRDTSGGKLQQLEGEQLKVWVKPADDQKEKAKPDKSPKRSPKAKETQSEASAGARVMRVEGTGLVRSTTPDLIIRHADYLNVIFQDVAKLSRPPKSDPLSPKSASPTPPQGPVIGPTPRVVDLKGPAIVSPAPAKKEPPKKEEEKPKPPLIVKAKSIESWVNRDPEGHTEVDRIHCEGDVEAHQEPVDGKQELELAGQTVDVHGYAEGYKLTVLGDNSDKAKPKWGVVRFDKLTMFGFDIVIDERTDTAVIKNEGSMEIMSGSDLDGKKVEEPTVVRIYWKHRMDFLGADKLIYYHGNVQAYEKASRCKCEWMQVLLDQPVYLNSQRREKARVAAGPKAKAKDKDPTSNVQIDTIMCFHAPKDEDTPRPKALQPVTVVQEVEEKGKVVRFQSIQAPEVVMVNTPLGDNKNRRDVTATSTVTHPGAVRIFQAGQKDIGGPGKKDKPDPKKAVVQAKGELREDEEMKLTIVQFGEKMWAEDLRKRAKFWTNVRVVHLPADRPNIAVDLREGDIPKGAIYMECRDTLDVFTTVQREKGPDGKEIDVAYQEMIGIGNVRVRKHGEFFGDADKVAYSEQKGTITLYGTDKNPASISQSQGQGVPNRTFTGRTLTYRLKDRTVETSGGVQIKN